MEINKYSLRELELLFEQSRNDKYLYYWTIKSITLQCINYVKYKIKYWIDNKYIDIKNIYHYACYGITNRLYIMHNLPCFLKNDLYYKEDPLDNLYVYELKEKIDLNINIQENLIKLILLCFDFLYDDFIYEYIRIIANKIQDFENSIFNTIVRINRYNLLYSYNFIDVLYRDLTLFEEQLLVNSKEFIYFNLVLK